MKKYVILVFIAVFAAIGTLCAQNEEPGKQNERREFTAKDRAERVAKVLELTDQQKADVLALYEKQEKVYQKMREDARAKMENAEKTRKELRAKFDEIRKAENVELEKIIGKEKVEKLNQINQERMKRRQANQPNRPMN